MGCKFRALIVKALPNPAETEIAQLARARVLPERHAYVHNAAIVSGTRPRFEFSSEIESVHHAGFCSSSCRPSVSPLDPLRTTITLRSLAFPGQSPQ